MIIEIMNKTECDNFLRNLLKEFLDKRGFKGEVKIIYPENKNGKLKIELLYDEDFYSTIPSMNEAKTQEIAKELCELKK